MPIYEFLCKTCKASFEILTSIGGAKNVLCVQCGSKDVQKLVSSFGIGGGINRVKSSQSCSSCSATSCHTCK